MERVLTTSEILDIIFFHANDASKAASAQVCKAWSSLALKSLWAELNILKDLFSLLSPIEFSHDQDRYEFERDITDSDWEVFDRYAPFVKCITLRLEEPEEAEPEEFSSIYENVSRTRTRLVLLPNLQEIKLDCEPISNAYSLMFFHSGLSRICIMGCCANEEEKLFRNVIQRAPDVKELCLYFEEDYEGHTEDNLVRVCSTLQSLRKVALPKFFLTAPVMLSLSKLPKLEEIQMALFHENGNEFAEGSAIDLKVFVPKLEKEAFPRLRILEIASTLKDATQLFSTYLNTFNLSSFSLNTPWPRHKTYFTKFFESLSSSCPCLESLAVTTDNWDEFEDSFRLDILRMDNFRPLLKLANMCSFEFDYPRPVLLVENDLAEFGFNWGRLKRLAFKTSPRNRYKSCLTLAALQTLAAHFPNLEYLGIYLDGSVPCTLQYPSGKFRRLKEINFGTSPLRNLRDAAKYISHLCTECSDAPKIRPDYDVWSTVSDMVHVALDAIREDRSRPSHPPSMIDQKYT